MRFSPTSDMCLPLFKFACPGPSTGSDASRGSAADAGKKKSRVPREVRMTKNTPAKKSKIKRPFFLGSRRREAYNLTVERLEWPGAGRYCSQGRSAWAAAGCGLVEGAVPGSALDTGPPEGGGASSADAASRDRPKKTSAPSSRVTPSQPSLASGRALGSV